MELGSTACVRNFPGMAEKMKIMEENAVDRRATIVATKLIIVIFTVGSIHLHHL